MTRLPRPSELYRLPRGQPGDPPTPPSERSRRPVIVVGGVVLAVLVTAALLLGPGATSSQVVPLDVVSEDQAVAALALFGEQRRATAATQAGSAILRPPGPEHEARALGDRANAIAEALRAARAQQAAEPLAAAYWSDPAHDELVHRLQDLQAQAADIGLLAAVHDTIYAGAGAVAVSEAPQALVSRFRTGRPIPEPLRQWTDTLLAQLDGHEVGPQAALAREAVAEHWGQAVGSLEPVAVDTLLEYVSALPDDLVHVLRGHPVAGPALEPLGV